jgi:hypothetical protein
MAALALALIGVMAAVSLVVIGSVRWVRGSW